MAEKIAVVKAGIEIKPADIPAHIATGTVRATLHAMQRYFEKPEVQKAYKKWLKENFKE